MALTSIPYLGNSLSDSPTSPGPEGQPGAPGAAPALPAIEDVFTPSSQNSAAQEAGLFQITQFALSGTPATAQAMENTSPTAGPATSAAAAQPSATAQSQSAALAASASAPPVDTLTQIQTFNRALAALGLTNNDIEKLDQIATLVKSFSPTAFGDLISQFLFFSQQSQVGSANFLPNTNASPGDFQVQSLAIQFNGAQESSAAGTGAPGRLLPNPAGLQLAGVQLSLQNGAGQAISLNAPQLASSGTADSR